jgi:hypothetical protein
VPIRFLLFSSSSVEVKMLSGRDCRRFTGNATDGKARSNLLAG